MKEIINKETVICISDWNSCTFNGILYWLKLIASLSLTIFFIYIIYINYILFSNSYIQFWFVLLFVLSLLPFFISWTFRFLFWKRKEVFKLIISAQSIDFYFFNPFKFKIENIILSKEEFQINSYSRRRNARLNINNKSINLDLIVFWNYWWEDDVIKIESLLKSKGYKINLL